MSRYTQEQQWDHRRDLAKHDWRPGDRPPPDRAIEEQRAEAAAYEAAVAYYNKLIRSE